MTGRNRSRLDTRAVRHIAKSIMLPMTANPRTFLDFVDPFQVGQGVAAWGSILFRDMPPSEDPVDPDFRDVAECVGYLMHAISLCGKSFEYLVDIAGHAVAACVAAITPDNRIPDCRRHGRLIQQIKSFNDEVLSLIVQLVKYIEIDIQATQVEGNWAGVPIVDVRTHPLKLWTEGQIELLQACTALHRSPRLAVAADQLIDRLRVMHHRTLEIPRYSRRQSKGTPRLIPATDRPQARPDQVRRLVDAIG